MVVTYRNVGDYTVRLDTRHPFGCSTSVSRNIHVVPLPGIEINGDLTVFAGRGIDIPVVYTGPIVNYNWTPPQYLSCTDCPQPFAQPIKTTTYKVTATDRFGCVSARDITLTVICDGMRLFVPNTFSPNGDGRNDVFYPKGGNVKIRSMRIFNRWGEMVYEKMNLSANDASEGWDGMHKGKPAVSDVYVYTMEIICTNGEIFPAKGDVMLLR
jgi:gliding motility-associated-like protein